MENDKTAKNCFDILSPITGRSLPLNSAYDPLFQQRIFGDGVLIEPSGYQVIAPFAGTISYIPTTHEQIRVKAKNGLEILIQLGFDAYLMMGLKFKAHIKLGQWVEKGQLLIEFDINAMKKELENIMCPVTIINSDKLRGITPYYYNVMSGKDRIMTLVW